MDPLATELARTGILVFLQASRIANMTEEQTLALFNDEKAKFDANDSSKLNKI